MRHLLHENVIQYHGQQIVSEGYALGSAPSIAGQMPYRCATSPNGNSLLILLIPFLSLSLFKTYLLSKLN